MITQSKTIQEYKDGEPIGAPSEVLVPIWATELVIRPQLAEDGLSIVDASIRYTTTDGRVFNGMMSDAASAGFDAPAAYTALAGYFEHIYTR